MYKSRSTYSDFTGVLGGIDFVNMNILTPVVKT
ncbi:uncharacterized protein METZ01_LOCUS380510 [marine metagenome]|uniref:Uncharacterized protein n=1 Tax=marine metagenome TaxID=408172 RepID=A0A382U013_9ZZZZ